MSTIYDELSPTHNAWIVYPGQLVEIRRNCFEQLGELGIIIECASPNFGTGYDDDFWVLVQGNVCLIKNFMIYPARGDDCTRDKPKNNDQIHSRQI